MDLGGGRCLSYFLHIYVRISCKYIHASNINLEPYKRKLERVKEFTFLGLWVDERLKWAVHIKEVINKCEC